MMTQMGMDIHEFHAKWHQQNKDPQHPNAPNSDWETNMSFGKHFLQMHHEMVEALDTEQKFFMHHDSIVSWFNSKGYSLLAEWNPLTPIPSELAFTPTKISLKRKTNDPHFALPKYFTVEGIMQQNNGGHSLHAFTMEGDFIPTLYIIGRIKAKGDLVGIKLDEVALSEQKPDTLGLKFVPDDYNPNGSAHLQITPYHKILDSAGQYKTVVIESQQGNISLEAKRYKRGEKPSFAGGGGEARRG